MLEQNIITHSAPTLAGLKTGSLFSVSLPDAEYLSRELRHCALKLTEKGLRLQILRRSRDRALIYIYRPADLRRDLSLPGVAEFLKSQGYTSIAPDDALRTLRKRLRSRTDFPHEIGLFLGYPLGDVTGFVENKGANCKLSGCWKVYGDPEEAQCRFACFKACQQCYEDLFRQGKTLSQLIVPARLPPS